MSKRIYQHLETLWQYMQMGHQLQKADVIIVLGSNDTRVAEVAASLYHQGLAPLVVFSGGHGRFTEGLFERSEAVIFAEVAKDCGLPSDAILLEPRSSNSGENVLFTYELLKKKGITAKKIILVQKPYMERRAYATFMQQWPEELESLQVTSQANSFFDYLTEDLTLDFVVEALIGDFERIQNYPAKGFQIEQEIPEEVLQAYQALKPLAA
ncbi:YdcF family protein [Vibrio diazotrophicus]|uniref:YdcF family protein n=1 Tax=Vibrio diazotrophicus TaxID=685 RepID=UPI0005A7C02C|nr:YdcF family protein [Vibrio diazotrophicus]